MSDIYLFGSKMETLTLADTIREHMQVDSCKTENNVITYVIHDATTGQRYEVRCTVEVRSP